MKRLRVLHTIMKRTHMYPIIVGFLMFILVDALVIQLVEPGINSYGDALWYCYVVMNTIGFGDIVAVTFIGRLASVLISIYALFVFAMVTGVVVNYHGQLIALQQKHTLSELSDKLQRLPEMTKEELQEVSDRARSLLGDK